MAEPKYKVGDKVERFGARNPTLARKFPDGAYCMIVVGVTETAGAYPTYTVQSMHGQQSLCQPYLVPWEGTDEQFEEQVAQSQEMAAIIEEIQAEE